MAAAMVPKAPGERMPFDEVDEVAREARLAVDGYTLCVNKAAVLGCYAGVYFMRSKCRTLSLLVDQTPIEHLEREWRKFRSTALHGDWVTVDDLPWAEVISGRAIALYRAFLMTADERIAAVHPLACANDATALEEAAGLRGCCAFIEVWKGTRRVGRVAPAHQRGRGHLKPELLAKAMEQMGQAFAIYDNRGHLVTSSRDFLQARSAIGSKVVPGAKWLDIVEACLDCRLLPEAIGREKQWLDWRRRIRGSYSALRELPDGTLWQVDERPMPSGVAVVWTDVSKLFGRTPDELLPQARKHQETKWLGRPDGRRAGPMASPRAAHVGRATQEPQVRPFATQQGDCMSSKRFSPMSRAAALETKASHQVMELVRKKPTLGQLVIRLREQGLSWREIQAVIETKIKPARPSRQRTDRKAPEAP
jgi:hypothetical protein